MNLFKLSFVAVLLGSTALAQPVFDLEAGASYFSFHREKFEPSPRPTSVKQDSPVAPFVALGYSFSETFGLRLSYHYVSDVGAEVVFPSAPVPIGGAERTGGYACALLG